MIVDGQKIPRLLVTSRCSQPRRVERGVAVLVKVSWS
jgi:hypothetical protein